MLKPTNCYLYPCTFETPSSIPKHHWWWFWRIKMVALLRVVYY
jgi:hypothetical protein